jgi:peptide-methionine (R)-S-oxide reductase
MVHNFAQEVYDILCELPFKKSNMSKNLSTPQCKALNRLRKRQDIVIKASDKGSGICILTPQQYTQEAMRQLNNKNHYKKLDENIIPQIQRRIKSAVEKHVTTGAIPPKSANLIHVNNPCPAKFYMLPKVHKSISNPPGRPIMAGNGNPTERLSEYIDEHIKQHISTIPSYIKDTNHFLEICRNTTLPPNARIVTFDVSSLYTNIPHEEGIFALGEFLSKFENVKTVKMLQELTRIVLESNIFEFDGKLYIQISGVAMGSKMAPSFAILYMAWLEEKLLLQAPIKPFIWRRFIDDIFAVFTCSDEELKEFITWINSIHPSIKFTAEFNQNGVPFLDTYVSIKGDKFVIRPHVKPTDNKQYVLPTSCHPRHIISSIPYSQALRIKRICTDHDTLLDEMKNLKGFFTNRGYDEKEVETSIQRVLSKPTPQNSVNQSPRVEQHKATATALIVPFHPSNPPFQKAINLIWSKHEQLINSFIGKPLVAFKRPPNIKDMLTKARFGRRATPPP